MHHHTVGDRHRIPWLTQWSTNAWRHLERPLGLHAYASSTTWKKGLRERASFAHFISLSSTQKLRNSLPFSVLLTANNCRRRRWRPANRGGAAFFSGEPPLQTKMSKHKPYLFLAGDSKSDFVSPKTSLKWPDRRSKKHTNQKP